jgi:hypothetical protein
MALSCLASCGFTVKKVFTRFGAGGINRKGRKERKKDSEL